MAEKIPHISAGRLAAYLAVAVVLAAMAAAACGVKSGERRPARPAGTETEGVFHRSPVTALEQYRVALAKTDAGCTATPADISVPAGGRVNLAIQLPTELRQGSTRSLEVVGERVEITYKIDGLEISGAAGAMAAGTKEIDVTFLSGTRQSYQFSVNVPGEYPILCDGARVGTFTVTG